MNDLDTKSIDDEPDKRRDHERSDVSVPLIVLSAIALAAVLVVLQPLLGWFLGHLEWRAEESARPISPRAIPEQPSPPLLQAQPRLDLQSMLQRDRSILDSYGWVDEERQIVRIPIERAMALIVEQGLPPVQKQRVPPTQSAEPTAQSGAPASDAERQSNPPAPAVPNARNDLPPPTKVQAPQKGSPP